MRAAVVIALALLGACASAPHTHDAIGNRTAPTPTAAPTALPMLADELAPSFEHRTRLARFDKVWLDDRAPVAGRPGSMSVDDAEYIVVDDEGDRVRLRIDDPWVRVLVWVERDQLRPTIVDDTAASGFARPLARGAALRVRAGAPLTLHPGADGARITVEDEHVTAFATVPARAVGDVWRVDEAPAADNLATRPRPPGSVAKHGEILDAPAPGAQILARVDRLVAVTTEHPSPAAGWHLVTLDTPYLSVTGYVADSSWIPGGRIVTTETEIFPGDASGVRLAAGTCLYARPGGALVGVVLVEQQDATITRRGWARWDWGTWWGRIPLYARPVGGGFESCPVAPSRGPRL